MTFPVLKLYNSNVTTSLILRTYEAIDEKSIDQSDA